MAVRSWPPSFLLLRNIDGIVTTSEPAGPADSQEELNEPDYFHANRETVR
jgi:hypothetical protein